jgi:hypothetical protein
VELVSAEPERKWEKEYHLDNGAIVRFGPLRVTHREEGDKLVMRVDVETQITIPGMECSVIKGA